MKIILIAAMNQDRVIGVGGTLPWHLPEDLKFFKRQTVGHAIIMGRRTYESMGRPLPRRRNLIITRQADYRPALPTVASTDPALEILLAPEPGAARRTNDQTCLDVCTSLASALDLCRRRGESIAFVIGGGEIFEIAMPIADEMLITHVNLPDLAGDTFFPEWDAADWEDAGIVDASLPEARRYVRR